VCEEEVVEMTDSDSAVTVSPFVNDSAMLNLDDEEGNEADNNLIYR
jgi:hypothetical protein